MKWITYNIMALAFLAAAMYLYHDGSHHWGWLVFLSIISAVTPTSEKSEKPDAKKEDKKSEEANFIKDIENRINDRNN